MRCPFCVVTPLRDKLGLSEPGTIHIRKARPLGVPKFCRPSRPNTTMPLNMCMCLNGCKPLYMIDKLDSSEAGITHLRKSRTSDVTKLSWHLRPDKMMSLDIKFKYIN